MEKAKFQMKTKDIEVKIEGSEGFVKEQADKSRKVHAAMFACIKETETPPLTILSQDAEERSEERVAPLNQGNPWIDHDVVAIYDEAGIPSFIEKEIYSRDMSINGFLKKNGIPEATLANIRARSKGPTADTIVQLSKALGKSADWILGLED